MNYAGIKDIDIQDGDGVRVGLYVSGCHFHCKECHNPEAWDFNYGEEFTEKEIDYILKQMGNSYITGLSILGGEPLELVNQKGLVPLVEKAKKLYPEKDIWLYTGYVFDKDVLPDMYQKYDFTRRLMDNIDIVVDGQFVIEKKLIDLKQRGSYNQRKIDVKQSILQNKAVCLKFGDEAKYEDKKEPKKIFVGLQEEENNIIPMPTFAEISIENIDQAVGEFIEKEYEEMIVAESIDKKLK